MIKKNIIVLLILIVFVSLVIGFSYNKLDNKLQNIEIQHEELIQEVNDLQNVKSELEELRKNQIETFPNLQVYEATITAYTLECGYPWADGITYTGNEAIPYYTVAVDPDYIPLGTIIYIEDIGFFKADDIGGKVKGWHIDIYVGEGKEARKEALKIGRQIKNIIIPI